MSKIAWTESGSQTNYRAGAVSTVLFFMSAVYGDGKACYIHQENREQLEIMTNNMQAQNYHKGCFFI